VTETVCQSFPTVFRNNINLAVQPPPYTPKPYFTTDNRGMNINSCNLMKCLCGYQDKTLKNSVYIGSSVTVKEINYCKMFKVCMLWVHWRSKGGWGPRAALCWL